MNKFPEAIPTYVTFPRSGLTYKFKSQRAIARMLSGYGTAPRELRTAIREAARVANEVKQHELLDEAGVEERLIEILKLAA